MANLELFNQPLKTSLTDTDRLATGIPGLAGGNNILISDFKKFFGLSRVFRVLNVGTTSISLPANCLVEFLAVRNLTAVNNTIHIESTNSDLVVFDAALEPYKASVLIINTIITSSANLSFEGLNGNFDVTVFIKENIF